MNNKKALLIIGGIVLLTVTTACEKKEEATIKNQTKEVLEEVAHEKANHGSTNSESKNHEDKNDDGHSWDGWTQLGTQTIDGWTLKGMQFGTLEEENILEASVEIEITPPQGQAQASAVRAWIGGKDSDSLKEKLDGHSHGGDTIAYFFAADLESFDQKKFMVQVEMQDGKEIFAEFELQ